MINSYGITINNTVWKLSVTGTDDGGAASEGWILLEHIRRWFSTAFAAVDFRYAEWQDRGCPLCLYLEARDTGRGAGKRNGNECFSNRRKALWISLREIGNPPSLPPSRSLREFAERISFHTRAILQNKCSDNVSRCVTRNVIKRFAVSNPGRDKSTIYER